MDELMRRRTGRRTFVGRSLLGGTAALGVLGASRGITAARAQDASPAASPAAGFDAAQCYQPFGDTSMVKYDAVGEGPFNIALSNSYIGNVWRTQMINMAEAFVATPDIAPFVSDFQVNSAGNDVNAQITAIENMISNGAQAIIINAADQTGLNTVVQRARQDGIVIVSFDNIVDVEDTVTINEDQVEMGRLWAQFLVDQLGGQGNVLMINGVAGTGVDAQRREGAAEVWAANTGITVVAEVNGDWDPGLAQTVTANALAANAQIDGVWCQGGTDGAVRAFIDAGRPLVPFAGEAENGFRKQMLQYADQFQALSIGQTPGMGSVAIRAAIDLLRGVEMPADIAIPLPMATTAELEEGVNVFPEQPDNFFTPIQVPACGVTLTFEEIDAQAQND
ncbi:MAG: ABC transporter substrate-binding protein [Chloroflexia bacterium]|nr:ABC transporter substrate-binding protein [Chloroflexia bacterium]